MERLPHPLPRPQRHLPGVTCEFRRDTVNLGERHANSGETGESREAACEFRRETGAFWGSAGAPRWTRKIEGS
eukprot:6008451-Pyramimonas_sp.AAC.2